jgi:surface protein
MCGMFANSDFNQPIGNWDVSKVQTMDEMFYNSDFNQDISKWQISKNCRTRGMFFDCHIEDKYKPYQNYKRID